MPIIETSPGRFYDTFTGKMYSSRAEAEKPSAALPVKTETKNGMDYTYYSDGSVTAAKTGEGLSGFLEKALPEIALQSAVMVTTGNSQIASSIGAALAPAASSAVQGAIGNAIVRGAIAEATGGDFLKGAALSGVGSLAGGLQPGLSDALGGGAVGDIASKALIGGGMSELSGGDFTQGALISGIGAGIDQAKLSAAEDYLKSLPGGYEIDAAPAPTEADVLAAITADQTPAYDAFYVPDTSFTPDYSLNVGSPVIPEMGAQGIQVPEINEVIDVFNQPVDYSLPTPDSGLGLVMPTAQNLDSMGGGQGIVIPVDGGVVAESGFIPDTYIPDLGDINSFINQPAPNVDVNIQELTEQAPENIDQELAVLDVIKAVAPYAVGALVADNVINQEDKPTGFDIVPIPEDWRSPEYNMAFTPDITNLFPDFPGAQQMQTVASRITAPNQYQLSDVINKLNYQSVPFTSPQYQMPAMQQRDMSAYNDIVGGIDGQQVSINDIINSIGKTQMPTFGMSNIVGNLQGSPVSIGDIISGIQSQYGQTPTSAMG